MPKLETPLPHRFMADDDTAFREHFLHFAEAEAKAMVESDGVGNDLRWKTVLSVETCVT